MATLAPFGEKTWPGLLGLADEDDIGEIGDIVFLDGDLRTADHGEHTTGFQLGQDLAHPPALHVHAGNPDNVGLARIGRNRSVRHSRRPSVTRCSAGVNAATSGKQATGSTALTPRNGTACSSPQYETSKRGFIRTISAMRSSPAARRPHAQVDAAREAELSPSAAWRPIWRAYLATNGHARVRACLGSMAARRRSTVTCRPP